ncbi:MAG: MFS transporter, partial [Acidobacteria bacterium]|nr:MFS transporter [Acidobacteriota bacterium]
MTEPTSSRVEPEQGHPQRWWVLAAMTTSLVLVVAGVSSLNLAIPTIRDALVTSNTELLWIIDSYGLVFAGLLLPAGAL